MTVLYSYLHGPKRHVTIARTVDLENMVVRFAYAVSHPSDVFRKELGRRIAVGRLEHPGSHRVLNLTENDRPLDLVVDFLATASNVPTCVRKLANEWIRDKKAKTITYYDNYMTPQIKIKFS